jgi:hypothetical protein
MPLRRVIDPDVAHSTGEENGDDRRNRTFPLTLPAASLILRMRGPQTDQSSDRVFCPRLSATAAI